MNEMITGGCHCGALRYTVSAPPMDHFICHCDGCRKLNGGLRLTGTAVAEEALTLDGELSRYTYQGGKAEIELVFCGQCSTQIGALPKAYPGMFVLRANTLDDQSSFVPSRAFFAEKEIPGLAK